jgi:hypothetical protein
MPRRQRRFALLCRFSSVEIDPMNLLTRQVALAGASPLVAPPAFAHAVAGARVFLPTHRITLVIFAAAALLASPGAVLAHSFPRTAEPAAGSTVPSALTAVVINFTEALEPHFSGLQVFDTQGHQVDKKDAHVDPHDSKRFSVDLTSLTAGTYKVVWHATSVDTHKTQGSYTFTVAP